MFHGFWYNCNISMKYSFLNYYTSYFLKECDDFHYGFNCNETCNVNCKGCNRTTGECQNGCNPGWTGNRCREGDMFVGFFYQLKSMFDIILRKKVESPFPSFHAYHLQNTQHHTIRLNSMPYPTILIPCHHIFI